MPAADRNFFLACVKENAYRAANRLPVKALSPKFSGSIAEYISQHSVQYASECQTALTNSVRVCPQCKKPNGYTLSTCNKCQSTIDQVTVSTTPNLFTAFALGIQSEPRFPLTVSIRSENERVLVFDDPLAISPLHFCAIPTQAYIPDWRFLLLKPAEGLAVSDLLVSSCHKVTEEQFASDTEWCQSLLATTTLDTGDMVMGYNFPPSQNLLHLQYMSPLLMPHQYMMFLRGVHYTYQRFFPVTFVEQCLRKLVHDNACLTRDEIDQPIEALIDTLSRRCGVDYDRIHREFLEKVDHDYKKYDNWKRENFGGAYTLGEDGESGLLENFSDGSTTDVAPQDVYDTEKRKLHNYGRSSQPTQPSMGYYSFSRDIGELDMSFMNSKA